MGKPKKTVAKVNETGTVKSMLDEVLKEGAVRLLQSAIISEVDDYIDFHKDLRDEAGHRLVVRNGRGHERTILTGLGELSVTPDRVYDKRPFERFTSKILPPYMRKTPSIEELIPCLYLKGISTGDIGDALCAILGPGVTGLSASTVTRMKEIWQKDWEEWQKRDLSGKRYVYVWADGIYFSVRLTEDRPCILVVMGTLEDGTKELIAVHDGEKESKLSWKELLSNLKKRGLRFAPKLAVGDGALGFWAALDEEFPGTKHQRCWVHKTANILNALPKSVHPSVKKLITEMYMAPTKKDALKAYDEFLKLYGAKYPKACECLRKDKDVLFTFYSFPAEHWQHIRTTNSIESTFATVRHRSRQTKGCGTRLATLTMVFKLAIEAEKHWRKIKAYHWIPKILNGTQFIDGIEQAA